MFKPTRFGEFEPEYVRVPLPSMSYVWAKTDGTCVEVLGWGEQPYIELSSLPKETRDKLLQTLKLKTSPTRNGGG